MIICFDLETTGLDKYNDKIIEIAMVKFDEKTFQVIDKYSCLINPEIEIPEVISNITNIFNEDIKGAPKFLDVKKEIEDFIGDSPLLWHNVEFDIWFLLLNWIDVSNNIKIDTFLIASFLSFESDSLNLEMLCSEYSIEFIWAHRALNDVFATINLFKKQLEILWSFSEEKRQLIHYLFSLTNDKNIKYLEDLIFSFFSENISFSIFEKILLSKIWNNKYSKEIFHKPDLICEDFVNIYNSLWKLEERKNQVKMTESIFDNLVNKKNIVIEAPTWLWKTFAYLIPSIIYSVKNKEKIYISTKTKTLQDQLFFKDLEFLSKNLWIEFSFSKLKWKKNYISIKGFFDYILLWELNYEEVFFLLKITLWLLKTEYWELEELNFFSWEYSFLKNLNTLWIEDNIEKNPYHSYEYLTKAREALVNSNITIINHSLLFISLENWNNSLPNLKNIVIDEAHNIEDSLTEALKETYNFLSLKDYLERCERVIKIKKIKKKNFIRIKEDIISSLLILDDYSISYLNDKINDNLQYKTILLKDDYFLDWNYNELINKIKFYITELIDFFKLSEEYDFSKEVDFFNNINSFLSEFFKKDKENTLIKVLNLNEKTWITYSYTLLNIGNFLEENLWEKMDCSVLTSATLTIWDSFDYFRKTFNLNDFSFFSYESDFDYEKQAMLFIPSDIWSVKNNSKEIVNFLKDFYLKVRWNTLTLLTNFAIIRQIYTECNLDLKKENINIYAQSIWWSKMKLISSFKDNPENSILLWTDSFWEWIDIPWDDLKYLIIHKFPFQVPTDPIFQARSVFYKDSFSEYSIPKAIIKLKQWFWRLIRTKNDKWIIVLLDNRIDKDWWKSFFEAFPKNIRIKRGTKEQFLNIIERTQQ